MCKNTEHNLGLGGLQHQNENMNGQLTYEQMFNFIPWRWNILFFDLLCVSVFPFQENVNNQFTCYVN